MIKPAETTEDLRDALRHAIRVMKMVAGHEVVQPDKGRTRKEKKQRAEFIGTMALHVRQCELALGEEVER